MGKKCAHGQKNDMKLTVIQGVCAQARMHKQSTVSKISFVSHDSGYKNILTCNSV